jgi:hypothetical protein
MAIDIFLFVAGLVLATLTLLDVFDTVVVPGGSRASLKVARLVAPADVKGHAGQAARLVGHLRAAHSRSLDDQSLRGAAALLREEGTRMARELAGVIGLQPRSSDYSMRADADFKAIADQRAKYRSCVDALANHLGKPTAVLVRQV